MKDAILLLLGAVAGVVAQGSYTLFKKRVGGAVRARRRRRALAQDDPARHGRTIVAVHEREGWSGALYSPTYLGDTSQLPIVLDRSGAFTGPVRPSHDDVVTVVDAARTSLPVDDKLLQVKLDQGRNLWDGDSLHVIGTEADDGRRCLRAQVFNYFAYVSLAQQIRSESAAVTGQKPLLTGLRTFDTALGSGIAPLTLAATTTCVFDSADGPMVAIQRRSTEVVNANGQAGVTPIFGLESNRVGGRRSRYGLLMFNFLKEFAEEIFGLEALISAASRPRASPDWIMSLPDVAALVRQLDDGVLSLTCTAVAVDLSDASVKICLLARFRSQAFFEHLQEAAVGSWESEAATPGRPAIEFLPLFDSRIEDVATLSTMDPGSIVSLDLAREAVQAESK